MSKKHRKTIWRRLSISEDIENPSNRRITRSYKDAVAGSHQKSVANPPKRPRFSDLSSTELDGLRKLALIRHRQLELNEVDSFLEQRLKKVGFEVSPSQPKTLADGNCFVHATIDQLSYDSINESLKFMTSMEIRTYVVDTIDTNPNIDFRHHGINRRLWKLNMKKSGTFCDDYFISHMAFLLNREIHIVSVFEEDMQRIITTDQNEKLPPIYVLHYPETRFRVGHYQSIRPILSNPQMSHSVNEVGESSTDEEICIEANSNKPNTSQYHEKETSSDEDILSFHGIPESQNVDILRSSDDDVVSFEGSENGFDFQNESNDDISKSEDPETVENTDDDLVSIEGHENEFDVEYRNIDLNFPIESQDDEIAKSTDESTDDNDDPEYFPLNSKPKKKTPPKKRRKGKGNFGRKTKNAKKKQNLRNKETSEQTKARVDGYKKNRENRKAADPEYQKGEADRKKADRSKARDPRKVAAKTSNAESHRQKRAEDKSADTNEAEAERKRKSRGTESGEKRLAISQNQSDINTKDLPISVNGYRLKKLRECGHCKAKLYKNEPDSFCCGNGQIDIIMPKIPDRLYQLLKENKKFKQHIRKYNNALALTSIGFDGEERMPGFDPVLKIHGKCYHRIGPLFSEEGEKKKFAQFYIQDPDDMLTPEQEAQQRIDAQTDSSGLDKEIMMELQQLLREINPYIKDFITVSEIPEENFKEVKFVLKRDGTIPKTDHKGQYNAPTCDEVALVKLNDYQEDVDVQLRKRGGGVKFISDMHASYDPMHYILLHPRGGKGWSYSDTFKSNKGKTRKMTPAMRYKFLLQDRDISLMDDVDHFNVLISAGKLTQEFAVNMWDKIERQRLKFLRKNQAQIHAESYQGLFDAIHQNDNLQYIGEKIILPGTFYCSPRWYNNKFQDGMALVRAFGKPDLFITFTANAKDKDLNERIYKYQQTMDRPDAVVRAFKDHLQEFEKDIKNNDLMGRCIALLGMIEFQKRGLPHCHYFLWLHPDDKPKGPEDYQRFVTAEIPDKDEDPEYFELVKSLMVHGPCQGQIAKGPPCMKDGKCTKGYPKPFSRHYAHGENGLPVYKRSEPYTDENGVRRNAFTIKSKHLDWQEVEVTNAHIVPHNKVVLKKYKHHINVEIVSSVMAIKYGIKYIMKGCDKVLIQKEDGTMVLDEIESYRVGRYISATDAFWKLFQFPMCSMWPAVQKLALHLENRQTVFFDPKEKPEEALSRSRETTLTAFFKLNQNDAEANRHLYCDILKYYTFDRKEKVFKKRKRSTKRTDMDEAKSDVVGRIPTITLNSYNKELYFLRLLLYNKPGPKSYEDLRTLEDGEVCDTFQETCIRMGLFEDDQEIEKSLEEASGLQFGKSLRQCFVTLVVFAMPANPKKLFEKFTRVLCEDYMKKENVQEPSEEMINKALIEIQEMFELAGKNMVEDYGLPQPLEMEGRNVQPREIQEEINNIGEDPQALEEFAHQSATKMNAGQYKAYDTTIKAVNSNAGGVFAIDAPGGTGKTFLLSAILAWIRSSGKIALATATTGIAATLLPGGRTVHSKMKVPINLEDDTIISPLLKENTAIHNLIKQTVLIVIDEMTMATRKMINALDRTLRQILNPLRPFGGIILIFSGDWRQTLPVVPRGSRAEILYETIKQSEAWEHVQNLSLTENMRLRNAGAEAKEFAEYLLRIGEGTEQVYPEVGEDMILIPNELKSKARNLVEFCDEIFPNIHKLNIKNVNDNSWIKWLMSRVIICPTNLEVDEVNDVLIEKFPGKLYTFKSFDKVLNAEEAHNFPIEFLNSIHLSSIPPHVLKLKIGCPFRLTRNIDPLNGHVNGQRYIVLGLSNRVIHAKIAVGPKQGNEILIPRIIFHPNDKTIPFDFERRQFPIRTGFSSTANGAQGRSDEVVGVNVTKDFFGHGQLYVAMSRVQDPKGLKIFKPQSKDSNIHNYTKNVVYKAALSNTSQNIENSLCNEMDFSFELDEWMEFSQTEPKDTAPIRVRDEVMERDPEVESEDEIVESDDEFY